MLAAAERQAYDLGGEAHRRHAVMNADQAVTLEAANKVVEFQLAQWRAAGYSEDEIAAAEGPQLTAAAIEKAAELQRDTHVSYNALKKGVIRCVTTG